MPYLVSINMRIKRHLEIWVICTCDKLFTGINRKLRNRINNDVFRQNKCKEKKLFFAIRLRTKIGWLVKWIVVPQLIGLFKFITWAYKSSFIFRVFTSFFILFCFLCFLCFSFNLLIAYLWFRNEINKFNAAGKHIC